MSKTRILFGILKGAALCIGGLLTFIALMALTSTLVDNGWAQFGIALVIAIGLPALIADRLLPPGAKKSNGVISDTYSIVWLGFALVFVGLTAITGDVLRAKAAEFHEGGNDRLASLTMWVAGPGESESPDTAPLLVTDTKAAVKMDAGVLPSPMDAAKPTDATTTVAESTKTKPEKKQYSPAELFKEMSPAVVTITVKSERGMGGGTGFIVDSSGIVITNHHVIKGSKSVSVKLISGAWASKVELLASDEAHDLAVLKITSNEELPSVLVGDSETVQVGERAISIGNPLGLEHTLTDGLVSARRTYDGQKMIQMSTPVSPGNSGGPLFNLQGEVIGVTTAGIGSYSGGQNLNLAVPINQVKSMLDDEYPDRKDVGGGNPQSGQGSW